MIDPRGLLRVKCDHNKYNWWDIRDWCFANLTRPATVYFYWGKGDFCNKAQLYRRDSKKLAYGCSFMNDSIHLELHFSDLMDRELFCFAWLGALQEVAEKDLPYQSCWKNGILKI